MSVEFLKKRGFAPLLERIGFNRTLVQLHPQIKGSINIGMLIYEYRSGLFLSVERAIGQSLDKMQRIYRYGPVRVLVAADA